MKSFVCAKWRTISYRRFCMHVRIPGKSKSCESSVILAVLMFRFRLAEVRELATIQSRVESTGLWGPWCKALRVDKHWEMVALKRGWFGPLHASVLAVEAAKRLLNCARAGLCSRAGAHGKRASRYHCGYNLRSGDWIRRRHLRCAELCVRGAAHVDVSGGNPDALVWG